MTVYNPVLCFRGTFISTVKWKKCCLLSIHIFYHCFLSSSEQTHVHLAVWGCHVATQEQHLPTAAVIDLTASDGACARRFSPGPYLKVKGQQERFAHSAAGDYGSGT